MKKYVFLMLLFVIACTSAPEVKPVYQAPVQPAYHNNNCCTQTRTVRRPVEVIYEDTTYTTVYEPKTYTSTKRVSMPYNDCAIKSLCR